MRLDIPISSLRENSRDAGEWEWIRLEDLAETCSGTTPPRHRPEFYNGGIPWVKTGELVDGEIEETEEHVTDSAVSETSLRLLPSGTVLVAMYGQGQTRGRTGLLRRPATTNQACFAILPNDRFSSEFLQFWFRHSYERLQRRIAARLREQLVEVAGARAAVEAQIEAAEALPAAILRAAFGNGCPLSIATTPPPAPHGWNWHLLTDLARLESGHTPSRYHPEWWGGDVSWIALPDIRALDGRVALTTIENTNSLGIANSSARILPENTVVLSRTASVGFVTLMGRPMATSQDFVNWVCGPKIVPHFLMRLFQAARPYVLSLASGAVHKTVYVPTVKQFRVCIPSLEVQLRLIGNLQAQLTELETGTHHLNERMESVKRLPTILLREAFGGNI